jgi:hypothetical protein
MSPFPRRATPNSEAHRYYAEGHLQDESRVALSSPASLLSRSITPFALFGRRFTISGGGMLVPVRALGLRHLANDEPSRGPLLAITLEPPLALPLLSFRPRSCHGRLGSSVEVVRS